MSLIIQVIVPDIIGFFGGPAIYGYLLDINCLYQLRAEADTTGACLYYDDFNVALHFTLFSIACKLLSALSMLVVQISYVQPPSQDTGHTSPNETNIEGGEVNVGFENTEII